MIRIFLKEPVGGGLIQDNPTPARQVYTVDVQGQITKEFVEELNSKDSGEWLSFIGPSGLPVLVPVSNISFMLELLDNVQTRRAFSQPS